jgi:5-methyltetrahydrofolate--homocysteine methyltransferase
MSTWQKWVEAGGVVLADGATGTMLIAQGLPPGDPPIVWNVERPDQVQGLHQAYLEAGARLILSNTFSGNRFRLAKHHLQGRVVELNQVGVRLAREAVRQAGGEALVAGDIGPTGGLLAPLGDIGYADAVAAFTEQASTLAAAGADLLWIETLSDLEEVQAAIEGARRAAPALPIIATMTFDTRGRTMMGVTPEQAVTALKEWGAAAVGANCGTGPAEVLEVIRKMKAAAPEAVLVAKPNAGAPELVDGRSVYRADSQAMISYAVAAAEAGGRLIGACCGSTPDHLKAMAQALQAEGLLG